MRRRDLLRGQAYFCPELGQGKDNVPGCVGQNSIIIISIEMHERDEGRSAGRNGPPIKETQSLSQLLRGAQLREHPSCCVHKMPDLVGVPRVCGP